MRKLDKKTLASLIDHTLLKADASEEMVKKYCNDAVLNGFASVCINPCHVPLASRELKGTGVKVCTVTGFPLGASSYLIKAAEAELAVSQGADEIDMVINIGALKEGRLSYVEEEIKGVVAASRGAMVKVILETCFLSEKDKINGCKAALNAGAHFVKTSTGFGPGGATTEDVALLRSIVGSKMGVKASGGIRSLKDAISMIEAGADRIGTSSGLSIIEELA